MRLTPWFRSLSTTVSDEETEDAGHTEEDLEVPIYRPSEEVSETERRPPASEFVPESEADLLSVLEGMNTPVTVDEVADRLIRPARPPVETWADVHERLHEEVLPNLDSSGKVEFDSTEGVVALSDTSSVRERNQPTVGEFLTGGLFVLFCLLLSVVIAVAVV
ncbi:hypothetical protein ACYJ1Y_01780 [Natrialbaceae archaeon A-gly3]